MGLQLLPSSLLPIKASFAHLEPQQSLKPHRQQHVLYSS